VREVEHNKFWLLICLLDLHDRIDQHAPARLLSTQEISGVKIVRRRKAIINSIEYMLTYQIPIIAAYSIYRRLADVSSIYS
jgi:hypothetical protein